MEDSLPATLTDTFETVRGGVKRSAEVYINLCTLLDRLAKRNEGLAADHLRFSLGLQSLTEVTRDTYAIDTNDVPLLNEGIKATAGHLSASQSLLEDEARAWETGILEDLKRQRDCLVSVREMFDRRDRYARSNIPQLERRIETNERKLQDLRNRPQGTVKPGEIEKVEESIFKVSRRNPRPWARLGQRLTGHVGDRTRNRLCSNMHAECSSGNASGTSWCISNRANITSVACTRTGARSGSNTRSCRLTTGGP